MAAVAFDTLKFSRALREKAKLSPEQADGFAEAIADAVAGDLATKSDIQILRADVEGVRQAAERDVLGLRAEIREGESGLRAEIREAEGRLATKVEAGKADILKWVIGMVLFQVLAVMAGVAGLVRMGLR